MAQDSTTIPLNNNGSRVQPIQPVENGAGTIPETAIAPVIPTPPRKTILIVDDILVMRLRMRPQLEEAGYRVIEAEDGEKALELVRKEPVINLIITDVSMPVMDGLEMIRKLRSELSSLHLPVIVCTARGEISVVRKAKLLGVQGFLVKPITKPTLLSAIKREIG